MATPQPDFVVIPVAPVVPVADQEEEDPRPVYVTRSGRRVVPPKPVYVPNERCTDDFDDGEDDEMDLPDEGEEDETEDEDEDEESDGGPDPESEDEDFDPDAPEESAEDAEPEISSSREQ